MRPFPKARVDALTDGIFAFAMTLLVVDVRLPDTAAITDASELWRQLAELAPRAVSYVISFLVLAALWRNIAALRHDRQEVGSSAIRLWTSYLLFVTMVPFSSALAGRYGSLPPAIWIYAGNMLALAALSIPLHRLEIAPEQRPATRRGERRMILFMLSALLSVLVSLWAPHYAMYAYLLNVLGRVPPFR